MEPMIEHARFPWSPRKNGMTSYVLGHDGSLDALHGSSFAEIVQDDSSRDDSSQAELLRLHWRRWRRRWRRFKRRLKRRFKKVHRALNKISHGLGDKLKAMGKVALKGLKACGASAAMGVIMGNPVALASTAECVKKEAEKVKDSAKTILSDAKAGAQQYGKNVAGMVNEASNAAGVTVAHIMQFGNQLENQAKASGSQASGAVSQAVQAMEMKAITETINGTLAVETKMSQSLAKPGQAIKKLEADVKATGIQADVKATGIQANRQHQAVSVTTPTTETTTVGPETATVAAAFG